MSAVPLYLRMTFHEMEGLHRSMQNKASWGRVLAMLTGRSRSLIDMATAVSGRKIRSRHYAGSRTVPINRIKGSEGRSRDFDCDFNPLHSRTIDRWLNVAIARSSGAFRPLSSFNWVQFTLFATGTIVSLWHGRLARNLLMPK